MTASGASNGARPRGTSGALVPSRAFAARVAKRTIGLLAVSLVVLGGLLLAILAGVLAEDEARESRERLDATRTRVERYLAGHLAVARNLAGDPVVAAAARRARRAVEPDRGETLALEARLAPSHLLDPSGEPSRQLRLRTSLMPEVRGVVFTEATGVAIGGTSGDHAAVLGVRRWWRRAAATGADVSLPGPGSGLPADALSVAVAIEGEGGRPSGVLQLLLELDGLRVLLGGSPAPAGGGPAPYVAAIIDADGSTLSGGSTAAVGLAEAVPFAALASGPAPPAEPVPSNRAVPSGKYRLVWSRVAVPPSAGPLALLTVALAAREEVARIPPAALWSAGAVLLLALAAGALLIFPPLRAASRDIAALVGWARRTGAGEIVPPPAAVSRADEIGALGVSLVSSLEGLRSSRAELEGERRSLEQRVTTRTAELAHVNAELKRRAEELAASSRAKDEFLTNVSHELRTPLNSIIGLTQLIRDGMADSKEESDSFLDQALASARHLLSLINDVLDVAKLEAGKVELDFEDVAPSEVVSMMSDIVRPLAAAKKLEFQVDVSEGVPAAHADRRRLVQVLVNVAQNAVKFTEEGHVAVRVRPSDGRRKVLFEVEDTGIGIPAGRRTVVFEKFIQAEAGTTRRFGGTGLGLPISRLLVEAMGGKIGLESGTGGNGTRVWFTVPAPGLEGR